MYSSQEMRKHVGSLSPGLYMDFDDDFSCLSGMGNKVTIKHC